MIDKLLNHYLNLNYTDRLCTVYYFNECAETIYIIYHYKYKDFEEVEHKAEVTISILELIAFVYDNKGF